MCLFPVLSLGYAPMSLFGDIAEPIENEYNVPLVVPLLRAAELAARVGTLLSTMSMVISESQ